MAGPIAVDGLPKKLSYIKENIFPVHNQVVKKIDRSRLLLLLLLPPPPEFERQRYNTLCYIFKRGRRIYCMYVLHYYIG